MQLPALIFATLSFVGLSMTSSARAADCGADATQTDLDVCAAQAFKKADAQLNADYRQILDRLKGDSATTKLFVGAEKAWIGFRDAECAFATSRSADGSIYPMLEAQCWTGLTQRRLSDLAAYLTCEEGDLSCPVPAAPPH
jgi:uncharacterized protein YecT (DUF1311 family)